MATAFLTPTVIQPRATKQRHRLITRAAATPPPSVRTPVKTPVYRRVPIVGLLYDVFFRQSPNIHFARRLGPVYKADLFGNPLMVITDIDAINSVYKNTDVFRSAGGYPKNFTTLFGEKALFNLDGKKHFAKRATVLPAFSPQLFALYFDTVRDAADKLWSSVSTRISNDGCVSMKDVIKDHYFSIILSITSGNEFTTSNTVPQQEQYEMLRDNFINLSTGNPIFPFLPSWRLAVASKKWLCETIDVLIRKRLRDRADTINALRANGADKLLADAKANLRSGDLDLLTVLCATSTLPTGENQQLPQEDVEELAELVILIWFGGYATQSSTTLISIMLAGKDENIWQRLRDEQDGIVAMNGSRDLTFDQVNTRMPLLDSYITEVLRMYPAAPQVFRQASEDTFVLGHKIDAGMIISLDFWGSQRDNKYYPEPDELIIDRFVRKDGVPTPPAIVSYGSVGGAHFCLGAALSKVTMKTTLATLLRNFDVMLQEGQNEKLVLMEMIPQSGVILDKCERRSVGVEAVVAS